jgi:NodT family efflux transporter outer membrane factor (OMF) lipoprotein
MITMRFAFVALTVALGGCSVGPEFVAPPAPDVTRYTPEKLVAVEGGPGPGNVRGERLDLGSQIPQSWWAIFHNKRLTELVEASVAHNPSIPAAEAAIRVAYYLAEAQKGQFLPQISANAGVAKNLDSSEVSNNTLLQNDPNTPVNTPYKLHLAQLNVSYVVDVWGQNRRTVESLEAQTDQQRYQLEAAYLALTSNVVAAAIQEATLRGQVVAVQRSVAIARDLLDLTRQMNEKGQISQADVLSQEAAFAQTLALLPPLEKQVALNRDLLSALAGQLPSNEVAQKFSLRDFVLPRTLPVSLPSQLVRQRPDVRAAEATLHSASAQVGVAIAARLPNFSLSANGGSSAFEFAQLLLPGTNFYSLAVNATQPIFSGFTLLNQQRSAEAAFVEAGAQYQAAVITAFQNVADALRALQTDTRALKAAIYAEDTAKKSLDIVREQLRQGATTQLAALNAQQTYLTASVTRVQAEGDRFADVAGLFMALGGGWKDTGLRDQPPAGAVLASGEEPPPVAGPVNKSWFPSF